MSTCRSARDLGVIGCTACGLVCRAPPLQTPAYCPRCAAPLHARKPDSLRRCWSLLAAAAILYLPANLLPIMATRSLTYDQADTIIGGVGELWAAGSWDLAIIVFVASVVVPLAKIIGLAILLLGAQFGVQTHLRWRARAYRALEFIGQWSMLDVFVVALLTAIVQFHQVAEVLPGPGAVAFGAVVVLTMLATMSFDPRLIWDAAAPANDAAPEPVSGETAG